LGGLIEPRALGVGYDVIADFLKGDMSQPATLRVLAVKAVIWSIALGSGTSGGVLAPLLIMGGALGAAFGGVLPPELSGQAASWALLGMAAMMGGTMRSPLTAIVFALELTHNLGALLPLTTACIIAHATTVLLLRRSILTEKVARRGHHVVREYIVDPFETIRVKEIMAAPVDTISGDTPVTEVVAFFTAPEAPDEARARHKSYPVVDAAGRLLGMVARADVLAWTVRGWPSGTALSAMVAGQDLVLAYEDELVGALADRMAAGGTGRVPVLRRADNAVVGLVARRDLLQVRATMVRQERERKTFIRLNGA
jgi:CBS domain-containing protein